MLSTKVNNDCSLRGWKWQQKIIEIAAAAAQWVEGCVKNSMTMSCETIILVKKPLLQKKRQPLCGAAVSWFITRGLGDHKYYVRPFSRKRLTRIDHVLSLCFCTTQRDGNHDWLVFYEVQSSTHLCLFCLHAWLHFSVCFSPPKCRSRVADESSPRAGVEVK